MALREKLQKIDQAEGMRLLDQSARRYFHMSGEDFLSAWDSGKFEGHSDPMKLLRVTTLIPYARPLKAETPAEFFRRFADRVDVGPILDAWSK